MPIQELPRNPSLENLRKQAKSLHRSVLAENPDALARAREFEPNADRSKDKFTLADAQFVIARTYSFQSWTKLKQYVALLNQHSFMPPAEEDEKESLSFRFVRLACLDYRSDHASRRLRARELLAENLLVAETDFYAAVTTGNVLVVKRMLQEDPARAKSRGGPHNWEPILYAAYSRLNSEASGHSTLDVARLLLEFGADPNAGFFWDSFYLFTALTGAFGEGEAGPIHQPEHQNCFQLARLLLEAGADPNDGQALYNRMFTGGTKHLELLFEFGLGKEKNRSRFSRLRDRVDAPLEMLQQQLAWAAKYNQFERARLLIDHGVDVNRPDSRFKRTPLELATLHGNRKIAELLLDHGARPVALDELDAFASACLAGDENAVTKLLERNKLLVERLGDHRVELLQLAAESGKLDSIRLMASLGFDLNAVKRTAALHHAVMSGDLEMINLLIDLGANPLIRDTEFNATPRGWAEYGEKKEVAEFLKQFE